MKNTSILIALLLFSSPAFSWSLFKNYDDCVLENMKGVGSDVAARLIRRACESSPSWSLFGNYKDCILENIKGVQSDVAARAVANACSKKYSSQSKTGIDYKSLTNQAMPDFEKPKSLPHIWTPRLLQAKFSIF